MIDGLDLEVRLEIDGGIKLENISEVSLAGADTFVAGSAIFGEKSYKEVISKMQKCIE
jgi:ribulose-phosphate 3-epimerase